MTDCADMVDFAVTRSDGDHRNAKKGRFRQAPRDGANALANAMSQKYFRNRPMPACPAALVDGETLPTAARIHRPPPRPHATRSPGSLPATMLAMLSEDLGTPYREEPDRVGDLTLSPAKGLPCCQRVPRQVAGGGAAVAGGGRTCRGRIVQSCILATSEDVRGVQGCRT